MRRRSLNALSFLALCLFVLESCSPVKTFKVPTAGMEPTILPEEEVEADMDAYRHAQPAPGDVVVLGSPQSKSLAVRRCVAVGGQTVEIRIGVLYVNNRRFDPTIIVGRTNPSLKRPDFKDPKIFPSGAGNADYYGPVTVPHGKFFVLGDNRDNSVDSRYFGFVDPANVRGKVLRISSSHDKSRVGILVH
jgi:signal peptidase I